MEASSGGCQTHIVSGSETLAGIALKYGMKAAELKNRNHLSSSGLYPGQVLVISHHSTPKPKHRSPESKRSHVNQFVLHTVKAAGSLSFLALQFPCSANDIKVANKLSSTQLNRGDTLLIPYTGTPPPGYVPVSKITLKHTMQKYESIKSIAKHYRITVSTLLLWNDITDTTSIKVGSILDIINNRSAGDPIDEKPELDPNAPTTIFNYEKKAPAPSSIDYYLNQIPSSSKELRKLLSPTAPPTISVKEIETQPLVDVITEKAIVLIPHCKEKVAGYTSLLPEKLLFMARDMKQAKELQCPEEIEMKEIIHAKVVERTEVVHSGYISSCPDIGELSYVLVMLDGEGEPKNLYFGMSKDNCEAFCFHLFQYLCSTQIKSVESNAEEFMAAKEDVGPPRLNEPSLLFGTSHAMLEKLAVIRNQLPDTYKQYSWTLAYSTDRDGISLRTFLQNMKEWQASLMFIEDSKGFVFGAFCSGAWRVADSFSGSGESFLFQLGPELQVYPWFRNSNHCFQLAKADHIEIGGGGAPGIWLDKDFNLGSSGHCGTYNSPPLASSEDFTCSLLEVWSFSADSLLDYN